MELLIIIILGLACLVFLFTGIIMLIGALAGKKKKLPSLIILGLAVISAIGIYGINNYDNSKVTVTTQDGIESMTIGELSGIINNNQFKFDSYIGCPISVEGKVTDIQGETIVTNINYKFSAVVIINGTVYVEVDADDPILKTLDVGDKVMAYGRLSTGVHGNIYMKGNNRIEKE